MNIKSKHIPIKSRKNGQSLYSLIPLLHPFSHKDMHAISFAPLDIIKIFQSLLLLIHNYKHIHFSP